MSQTTPKSGRTTPRRRRSKHALGLRPSSPPWSRAGRCLLRQSGTSEMHFVSALDRIRGLRPVLCLFEGVATGAADGYAA